MPYTNKKKPSNQIQRNKKKVRVVMGNKNNKKNNYKKTA